TRLLREYASRGDSTGAKRRGGSRTARGKRVPEEEIHVTKYHVRSPFLASCPVTEFHQAEIKSK
ncbi:hypothetical protein, partial [Peribacillus simplex]|uniref:hypothetical protein n=1 Tax=Peribacillus simplex TaxID=1478 RepID=UPI00366D44A8